jgi:hypothetical protein
MVFRLPRTELNIALNCIDSKDKRPYLVCVYVFKEGHISATNGKIAYLSHKIEGLDIKEDIAFFMEKKPAGTITYIDVHVDELVARTYNKADKLIEILPISIVESKRVDYPRFVANHVPSPTSSASINPQVLKILSQFTTETVTLTVGEVNTPSIIKSEEGMILLMPQEYTDMELPELVRPIEE